MSVILGYFHTAYPTISSATIENMHFDKPKFSIMCKVYKNEIFGRRQY